MMDATGDLPFGVPSGRFETWPLHARHRAMTWLASAFREWPRHFVDVCTHLRVHSYAIVGHRGVVPYWFARTLREHLYRPWYAPTPDEVASVRRAMEFAHQPDTHYNRRRWLGRYYEKKPYMKRAERMGWARDRAEGSDG